MIEKLREFTWRTKLFFICVGYDIKSVVIRVRIRFIRMRISAVRYAVEVLKK